MAAFVEHGDVETAADIMQTQKEAASVDADGKTYPLLTTNVLKTSLTTLYKAGKYLPPEDFTSDKYEIASIYLVYLSMKPDIFGHNQNYFYSTDPSYDFDNQCLKGEIE